MTTKIRTKPTDKVESHKKSQRDWYQRRGCFLNYRNRIARRVGLDISELRDIENVQQLETWAHDYILKTTGNDLNDNCIPYIIYMIPKTPKPS